MPYRMYAKIMVDELEIWHMDGFFRYEHGSGAQDLLFTSKIYDKLRAEE